jgi:hypothetical protein
MPPNRKRTVATRRRSSSADLYPLSSWRDTMTGREFLTITVRQDNGSFLSLVAEDPGIRATAKTPARARRELLKQIKSQRNPVESPEDTHREDAEDIRVLRRRKNEPVLTREQFLRRHDWL